MCVSAVAHELNRYGFSLSNAVVDIYQLYKFTASLLSDKYHLSLLRLFPMVAGSKVITATHFTVN